MNQLWTKCLVFALTLLVATAPPFAIGQTPAPPAPTSTPVVEIPPGQEGTFPVEGARNGGRLLSAKSADPSLVTVDVIDTASFTGLNLKCAAGKTGVAAITYTWRDAAGKEQTSHLVVACGIKIAKSVTTTIAPGEATTIEATTNAQDRGHGATSLFSPNDRVQGPHLPESEVTGAGIKLAVAANFPEGIYIFSYTFRSADGPFQEWIITMNVGRKRVSQVIIPENGIRQAVSAPLCPPGSPPSTERSGMATGFASYYARSFGDQFSPGNVPGMQNVYFITCQPNLTPDRYGGSVAPVYSVGAALAGPNAAGVAQLVYGTFSRRVRASNPPQNLSGLGPQALGVSGSASLPEGKQEPSSVIVAPYENVVYWVSAQGMGVPPNITGSPLYQIALALEGKVKAHAPLP